MEPCSASGTTFAAVARDLGIDDGTLSKLVRTPGDPEANIFRVREENRRLKRKLTRMKEENERWASMSRIYYGTAVEALEKKLEVLAGIDHVRKPLLR